MNSTEIWTFRYEPKTFQEMILSEDMRSVLGKVIKEMPNIMLVGNAGVGKGTFTNILLKETKLDYMKINCSDETSVDAMRTKVKSFATALGITPLKIVILNEMDFLSGSAQAMLRDLMESVHGITRFILQCNYGHKVIPELQSRCQVIELNGPPMKDIGAHCLKILKAENITVKNKAAISETIKRLYPDIRKIINTLQMNSINNVLDTVKIEEVNQVYSDILKYIKAGDLDEIRKSLRSNAINYPELYSYMYENAGEFKSPGDAILAIGEHLYRDSIIAIKEINFMAFVVEMIKRGII
jgi:DNA polymerase III delta prime subunit